ncbi:MAG: PAS domain S-box protein [Bacteroidales bacterium]|jgi:PAS domain S-box-containing protein|nr:PAS domain S-box protein [Bacteroidales bacterium]
MEDHSEIFKLKQENKRLTDLLKDSDHQRIKERFLLQKLDLFNENNPLAVIEWDLNSCVTYWNKSAEIIFGYTKEEANGKRASELIIPDSDKEVTDKIWDLLCKNKEGSRSINENIRKDGNLIVCDWYNIPNIDANGTVKGVSSMALDITEKNKLKQKLDESNARYKMLSELTFEGIIIHKKGIAIDVNSSLERITLYKREEIIGKNVIDQFIPDEYKPIVNDNIKNKYAHPYEIKIKRKDGELIWVEIEAKNIYYQGEDVRTVAIRNIEKRKQNEQKLKNALFEAQESDRLKSTFLSTISHELRTPLNSVIGFSDLIDESMDITEATDLSKMILKSGNHLLEIINDIFELSMLEEGTTVYHKEKYNLHALLDEIEEYIFLEKRKMNKEHLNIIFKLNPNDSDLQIETDRKHFKQIFIHLLKNSLKYTQKGTIEVGYKTLKNQIKFYIKDTGIGIAKEKQKHIFEVFRQLDDKHTRAYEGVGIGLSIAKTFCENLGGEIYLESEMGKGSTFYFTLPYENERAKKEADPRVPIIDLSILNGKTILIAEDDANSFGLLVMYLKPWDTKIIWAKNGVEAISRISINEQIDIVLMDIKMPLLSGLDATKEIKLIAPNLPIIAQTAYAINNEKEEALEAGCDDYISKPINWKDLSKKMATLLSKRKK